MARFWRFLRVPFGRHELRPDSQAIRVFSMWTWTFWRDALERSISTAAQAVIGLYVVGDQATGAIAFDLQAALIAAGTGFGLTLLKSIAAGYIGTRGDASLIE